MGTIVAGLSTALNVSITDLGIDLFQWMSEFKCMCSWADTFSSASGFCAEGEVCALNLMSAIMGSITTGTHRGARPA